MSRFQARPGLWHAWLRVFLLICLASLSTIGWAELDPRHERHRQILNRSESIPVGDTPDARCRVCHGHLLDYAPLQQSPAGLAANDIRAWYQQLSTYTGEQTSFHWRHRKSSYAEQVMRMQCQTCHVGRDPLDPPLLQDDARHPVALRKRVNTALCINCHGQFPDHRAAFKGSWSQVRAEFNDNCLVCHRADAQQRHQNPLLIRAVIEQLGAKSGDVCYGCHGGRAWYAVSASTIRGQPFDLLNPSIPEPRQKPLVIR